MRYADLFARYLSLGALCIGATACASLSDMFGGSGPTSTAPSAAVGASVTVVPANASSTAAAPAPARPDSGKATQAAAQSSAPAKAEEPAVDPAAQRAFDAARRALGAGRVDEAERGFRALTQSNPELGGPYANLGIIYRQAGKLAVSAAALEQATRLSPKQAVYFNQLGITYRLQGQFQKARTAYEQAIALDPNYAAPVLNLGILHDLYLWDAQRALESYNRYLALSPNGDPAVTKWVADLKNRKPQQQAMLSRKEQE